MATPSTISTARLVAYLRALAETGNATLAAAQARVSRDWAYKRRKQDAEFDRLCRELVERFREWPATSTPPPLRGHSIDPHGSTEPLGPLRPPTANAAGPSLSREGRGVGRRVQVRRDRKGGWTAAKEARFIERLRETASAWLAAAAVGISTVSAYRRRQRRPDFAAAWDEAQRIGWPPADQPWIESALCFFEGRSPPPDNPVRITNLDQVIEAMRGNRFVRRPRAKRP